MTAPREGAVGRRDPLLEGRSFVTGAARYTTDLRLPNMLTCRLLYSDEPHARVIAIRDAKARALPGVVDVITAGNVPDAFLSHYGLSVSDKQLLATDKVRSTADVVAAVAAVDEATAEQALHLIEVDYEPLPAVVDVRQALTPDAVMVHDATEAYRTAEYITPHHDKSASNVSTDIVLDRGDVPGARAASTYRLRRRFSTQRIEHVHMEPHATLAQYDAGTDRYTIWTSHGKPFRILAQLGTLLDHPLSRLSVVTPPVGGDFGGKGELAYEPYCALLARRTGRPVKGVFTREEEFTASTSKVPFDIDLEIGADAEGRLQYMVADVLLDAGAYNHLAAMVSIHGITHLTGPYAIANLALRARTVYTNTVPTGAFRGFGAPQVAFGRETLLDELAEASGIDPLRLRTRNAWRAGAVTCTGQVLDGGHHSVTIQETLQAAQPVVRKALAWRDEASSCGLRRGVGIAAGHQGVGGGIWTGADTASAIVRLNLDGSVSAQVGVADVGQGTGTGLRQILAEELRLPSESVGIALERSTDTVPFHGGSSASRQLFTSGNAIRLAGEQMRAKLLSIAARMLGAAEADLELDDGQVYVRDRPGVAARLPELAVYATNKIGEEPMVRAAFSAPVTMMDAQMRGAPFQTFDYMTQVAEVEIDAETGRVYVRRVTTVEDVGRAINPTIVEGQIDGCVAQGLGFALYEDVRLEGGRVMNPFLFSYRVPRMEDMPASDKILLELGDPMGPHGAKAVGEAAIVPIAAAIANAIYDATGFRPASLPMTPELVQAGAEQATSLLAVAD